MLTKSLFVSYSVDVITNSVFLESGHMNKFLISTRKNLGLTISQAANEIGISHGMLAMLESQKRKGSDTTKIKIARYYKKSIEELFYNY